MSLSVRNVITEVMMQMQETSPSVVFIKDLELTKGSNDSSMVLADDENAKVEGTGSGFIWDKFGHIVRLFVRLQGLQICNEFSMLIR